MHESECGAAILPLADHTRFPKCAQSDAEDSRQFLPRFLDVRLRMDNQGYTEYDCTIFIIELSSG
jgi:hypothetical protein